MEKSEPGLIGFLLLRRAAISSKLRGGVWKIIGSSDLETWMASRVRMIPSRISMIESRKLIAGSMRPKARTRTRRRPDADPQAATVVRRRRSAPLRGRVPAPDGPTDEVLCVLGGITRSPCSDGKGRQCARRRRASATSVEPGESTRRARPIPLGPQSADGSPQLAAAAQRAGILAERVVDVGATLRLLYLR